MQKVAHVMVLDPMVFRDRNCVPIVELPRLNISEEGLTTYLMNQSVLTTATM